VRQPEPVLLVRPAGEVRHARGHREPSGHRVVLLGWPGQAQERQHVPAASFASIQLNPDGELSSAHMAGEPR